jgi:nucleotide-binding universal stress UspA family protein
MVTYLIGTDGTAASEAIGEFLEQEVDENDTLEVIFALTSTDDTDESFEAREALSLFEERFENRASVVTHQFGRGRSPTEEILYHADEVGADQIVIGLRRHSRTERIIFGSVSHALLERVTCPITLVPLPEYQPPEDET